MKNGELSLSLGFTSIPPDVMARDGILGQISTQVTGDVKKNIALWAWTYCPHVFNSTQCLTVFHCLELVPTFEKILRRK